MKGHPVRGLVVDMVGPIAAYYGIRAAGGSLWLALVVGGVLPVISTLAAILAGKRIDPAGLVMVAALTLSAALSVITGSPRALLARDGLITAGWAGYMYLSLLASRPVTFAVTRPLLEGRRVFDYSSGGWVRPADMSWDELWERLPGFRRIWRVCTVMWGTALLADAVIRVIVAETLPINAVPAVNGALWPVTFIVLQVVTNIYFASAGLWRILRTGRAPGRTPALIPSTPLSHPAARLPPLGQQLFRYSCFGTLAPREQDISGVRMVVAYRNRCCLTLEGGAATGRAGWG
ncbi:MAG TPA: VC0807 family protein [Streptosporangiaceae bacterium]|nr:VC0807 family protein [Streptosporangiaceae bacterium]